MIPILEPIFQGPLAALGDALIVSSAPPPHARPATCFTDGSAALHEALQSHAAFLQHRSPDLRPVASAWSMAYLGALLPPVSAAATLLQHVFPVAATQTRVTLDSHGTPLAFYIAAPGTPLPDTDAWTRYAPLVLDHLAPLFTALSSCSRIPEKILWGNAARHFQGIFDTAGQLLPQMPLLLHDRQQLLHAPHWGGTADLALPNPLHARERCVQVQEDGVTTMRVLHRQCCLYYLLAEHDYCDACPLDPRIRAPARTVAADQD